MYTSPSCIPNIKTKDNMTHNKIILLATAAILSVASISCSKDDDDSKQEEVNTNEGKQLP